MGGVYGFEITNQELLNKIELRTKNQVMDIGKIAKIAKSITVEELNFSFEKESTDPNKLITTKKANCIGYSSMFNSFANQIIISKGITGEIESKHKIGKLELLGLNIHQFLKSPFFRDHDFNQLRNLKTGEVISIDPSLSDIFWIEKVTIKTNKLKDGE
ncbi:MAG: hypothetical protein R2774_10035 [Saprospiraceae bacterium]